MKRRRMVMSILFIIGAIGSIYLALCAFLYVKQDDFIFYRVANDPALVKRWQAKRVEIATSETTIEGWWSDNPDTVSNAVVLYFGGNAEDVLYAAQSAAKFNARHMLVTNYRGYGATRGRPNQQALLADALAIYDYAVMQPGVSANNIVVMGRSLGSGVATYLAASRPVRGVVLVTPYDSLVSVAQDHYRYVPIQWLLKSPMPATEWAHRVKAPVLVIAGELDDVIPPNHARELFGAFRVEKAIHVLPGVGHNDIDEHAQYSSLIQAFLLARTEPARVK